MYPTKKKQYLCLISQIRPDKPKILKMIKKSYEMFDNRRSNVDSDPSVPFSQEILNQKSIARLLSFYSNPCYPISRDGFSRAFQDRALRIYDFNFQVHFQELWKITIFLFFCSFSSFSNYSRLFYQGLYNFDLTVWKVLFKIVIRFSKCLSKSTIWQNTCYNSD